MEFFIYDLLFFDFTSTALNRNVQNPIDIVHKCYFCPLVPGFIRNYTHCDLTQFQIVFNVILFSLIYFKIQSRLPIIKCIKHLFFSTWQHAASGYHCFHINGLILCAMTCANTQRKGTYICHYDILHLLITKFDARINAYPKRNGFFWIVRNMNLSTKQIRKIIL